MKKIKVKQYYGMYEAPIARYGYRHLSDVYNKPSIFKRSAQSDVIRELGMLRGHGYTVISFTIQMFTCGYLLSATAKNGFACILQLKEGK